METIKFLTKKDYEALYQLRRICFTVLTTDIEQFCKENYYDEQNWIGLFIDSKLVSVVWIKPLIQNFNGNIVKSGGLGSVATLPDYRYKGYSKRLINKAINVMKERKYLLSSLAPFLESFYEKFDYYSSIKIKQLTYDMKALKNEEGEIQLDDVTNGVSDVQKIITIREYQLYNYQLKCYRNEFYTKQYLQSYRVKGYQIKSFKEDGYVVFKEHENEIKIIEIEYKNKNILSLILSYIYNKYSNKEKLVIISPLDDIIKSSIDAKAIDEKIIPDKMTRIIDIKGVLELTKFKQNMVIKIDDLVYDICDNRVKLTNKMENATFTMEAFTKYIIGCQIFEQLEEENKVQRKEKVNMNIEHKIIYENEVY